MLNVPRAKSLECTKPTHWQYIEEFNRIAIRRNFIAHHTTNVWQYVVTQLNLKPRVLAANCKTHRLISQIHRFHLASFVGPPNPFTADCILISAILCSSRSVPFRSCSYLSLELVSVCKRLATVPRVCVCVLSAVSDTQRKSAISVTPVGWLLCDMNYSPYRTEFLLPVRKGKGFNFKY